MDKRDLSQLVRYATGIATEAGRMVLPGFGTARTAVDKGSAGLATQMDLDAEKFLVGEITTQFPDDAIIAEEGSNIEGTSGYSWVIDPIDGTHNYMHGIPFFGVSLALKQGDEYVVGVIYLPKLDETFSASKGGGAFFNGEPMTCSKTERKEDAFIMMEMSRRMDEEQRNECHRMATSVFRSRSIGCCGGGSIAYTAAGKFDAYLDPHNSIHEWDWAAGRVLIEESGGIFTLTEDNRIFAGNQKLITSLQEALSS